MVKLPDAELRVMLAIWNASEPLTSNEIQESINEKDWHIATLNKFLTRLLERDFILIKSSKRPKTYWYKVQEAEYKEFESKSLFKKLHKNSFKSLVASLYSEKLTDKEIGELEELIKMKREKK